MERALSHIASAVNEIVTFVRREAQSMEIDEVERGLLSLVMAVGRAALEEFVFMKGTGYAGKETIDAQGNRIPYVCDRSCAYRSIFGTISVRRAYYHADGSPGVFPLDGELNLPDRGYSYLVQEFSSRLAVAMSYEDAQEVLGSLFPVKMPIRSLESIVDDVRNEVDRFYEEKAPPIFVRKRWSRSRRWTRRAWSFGSPMQVTWIPRQPPSIPTSPERRRWRP